MIYGVGGAAERKENVTDEEIKDITVSRIKI